MLEVVGDQVDVHPIILELLTGDQVENGGGGLDADAVVDDARAAALLSHSLVHAVVGVQDPQDVRRHAHTEVAVGDIVAILHLQGALVQEGDELALQPLQVAVSEVVRSLEGELGLILVAGIQGLLQTLVLHTAGDDSDAVGHLSNDIPAGEVVDAVLDISAHLLRQAHFDVGPGGDHELLHAVLEAGVDGVSVLVVRHGGIEVYLLHAGIATQEQQDRFVEVQRGVHVHSDNGTVGLLDVEHAGHGVGLRVEVGDSALSHGNVLLINSLAVDLDIDVSHADVAVDPEQRILTGQQEQIPGVQLDTLDQLVDHQLSAVNEGNGGVGSQGIDHVLFLVGQGSLDSGGDLLDFHGLLLQNAGVEQTMQHGLIRRTHSGRDTGGQRDQAGHQGGLIHAGTSDAAVGGILDNVVPDHLGNAVGVFLQHGAQGVVVPVVNVRFPGVVLEHDALDLVGHSLDLDGLQHGTGNGLADEGATFESSEDVVNVAAFRHTAKQCTHNLLLLSVIKYCCDYAGMLRKQLGCSTKPATSLIDMFKIYVC